MQAATTGGFHYKSIEEYHQAYLEQTVTPLEIAERVLEYLKNDKTNLNAVPELNIQDVLEQAAASTERYKNKKSLGKHGRSTRLRAVEVVPTPISDALLG